MSAEPIRSSKRVRKPSAKVTRAPKSRKPAQVEPLTPQQSEAVVTSPTPVSNNVLLSDIHRELLSLREQVTLFRRHELPTDVDSAHSHYAHTTVSSSINPPIMHQANITSDLQSQGPWERAPIPSIDSHCTSLTPATSSLPIPSTTLLPSSTMSQDGSFAPNSALPPTTSLHSILPSSNYGEAPIPISTSSVPVSHASDPPLTLPAEELLAARDSDTDSDAGESSAIRASRKLRKKTMSVSGSMGASLFGGLGSIQAFSPPITSSIDPRLKLRILKNLFVPFEVLVAGDQGKSIHHYLKNPFLTPFNDPKLKVYYPRLNFDTWAEGLNIFMLVWTEAHPEDSRPLMQYLQMIRHMSKVFPPSVWLGYDREFRILRQNYPNLPWNVPIPQIYFQQLMKVSPVGHKLQDFQGRDRSWNNESTRGRGFNADRAGQEGNPNLSASKVFRRGYCTHYNLHGSCRRIFKCASLAHRCSVCDGPHGASQCRRQQISSGGNAPVNSSSVPNPATTPVLGSAKPTNAPTRQ